MSDTTNNYWHTKEDDAVLCTEHALVEINSSAVIQIGLIPPFATFQDVRDRFAEPPISEPDYFIGEPTGTCVECKRLAESASAMGEDVA